MYDVKMIIAGGRDFEDYNKCRIEITKIINLLYNEKKFKKEEMCIIGGRAKGADALGEYYANKNVIEFKPFPADWNTYGKRAGMLRNKDMAEYCIKDCNRPVLLAFWDGQSRGTKMMIEIANELGIRVKVVNY